MTERLTELSKQWVRLPKKDKLNLIPTLFDIIATEGKWDEQVEPLKKPLKRVRPTDTKAE